MGKASGVNFGDFDEYYDCIGPDNTFFPSTYFPSTLFPTFPPTSFGSGVLTQFPNPNPAPKPTPKPTRKPTPKPTRKPTRRPTRRPTPKPNNNCKDKKNRKFKITGLNGKWTCKKV